ncbi:MAG: serine--tRNA ligase [Bacteriovoracaceae bacterium]
MYDIKYIVDHLGEVKANLQNRNGFNTASLDELVSLNDRRKTLTTEVEVKRALVNKLSKEIGALKAQKKNDEAAELMSQVSVAKVEIETFGKELEAIQVELDNKISVIPNMLGKDVPIGKSEEENVEFIKKGTPKNFDFKPVDHVELGEKLGCLDFEIATRMTGARFVLYKGAFARLERALINFMLDSHQKFGYQEIIPPYIVHAKSLYGTGQLPKFKEDLFKIEGQDWYLIPTSEVPLTNIKREELFDRAELPLKMCAYSPCFRSEAGSYGKDTRGLIRLHQFNKVELVNIVEASKSEEAHKDMIDRACSILDALNLPYRAITLCSGDTGFGSRKTIDLEVWLPSQNKYREISSISNCGDFQARRAQIRYRNAEGKPEFAHTLNGSGLAVGRTLVAIVENYQNKDGSITIPEVLRGYMGGQDKIV